jgi:hypothetical protein
VDGNGMTKNSTTKSGGGLSTDKLIGAIIGPIVAAFLIAAVIGVCCYCYQKSDNAEKRPRPIYNYDTVSSHQMPTVQPRQWFSNYGDVQHQKDATHFQKSPFPNEPARRYEPNNITYGGRD